LRHITEHVVSNMSPTIACLCPVCGSPATDAFLTLTNVPVTCASVFESREAAQSVPVARIELATCRSCGFVFNQTFDPSLGDLGAQYESSQGASAHFGAYARSLATEWIAAYGLAGKPVIEVGCGDGSFMHQLVECGAGRVTGVDPLGRNPAGMNAEIVQVIAEPFDESHLTLPGAALVCRHTLEHIPDVRGFLSLLHKWAIKDSARVLLVEIPDAERIFEERAFWDIYYEHCNYFTLTTATLAFEIAGFEILSARRLYGGQYLVIEARARTLGAATPHVEHDLIAGYRAFANDVRAAIDCCAASVSALTDAEQPLVLWQGAAKTVGFMSALPNGNRIEGAIDLNPLRDGRFLPGSGLPVHAPEKLPGLAPQFVVLMNPVYLDEVRQLVSGMQSDATVLPINDLLTPDFVRNQQLNHSITR
jgi:Methyltransferase domain/C-methyltransferase C-terminal domain